MPLRFLHRAQRPIVLGHRGASASQPENTLRAFRQAMLDGADGVELDVMRCGSGEVVVVHDDDLGRVTGGEAGSGIPVRTSSLADIRRYDVGRGERVPTLCEVLDALGPSALVNIELKSRDVKTAAEHASLLADDGLAQEVALMLRERRRTVGTTLVSSFDPFQLWRFRRACGHHEVPMGFLFHRTQVMPLRQGWPARALPVVAVHPDAALIDAVAMRRWRRRGLSVHAWTVDSPYEVDALCALGVDAIITNQPGAVRAHIDRARAASGPAAPLLSSDHSPR